MLILDHTFDAKRFSPLVYDQKVIDHYTKLQPGTLAYDDFWDEQDERCLFGYKPKGMHDITGEHYFYLNMTKIEMLPQHLTGRRRKMAYSPYYRELDNRLFKETADAKKNGHGLIIAKPRRVGLSWFGSNQITYEMLFSKQNRVGICAGKQDKADAFYAKVMYILKNIRDEYKVARLKKDDKILKLGYIDYINKQKEEFGLLSEMLIRTMFVDSAGFEGESLTLAIFEEAGLFQNLIQSFKSTEPCFREGGIQFGTPLIYGTGGEIDKGAKGYMEMWNSAASYNLHKVFIPADEYYPGDGEVDEKGNKGASFFDLRTGQTDREAARKHILAEREKARKSKDGYVKHVQNYPLKDTEVFLKTSGGLLNRALLADQQIRISEGDCPYELRTGRLEWVDDEITIKLIQNKDTKAAAKIRISRGSKLKWVDDPRGTIQRIADPINKDDMVHKPDIGGCDSYDEEVANEENASKGATVIYRTYAGPSKDYNLPIAVLLERGDSSNDDTFYENTLKLTLYYNIELLFEYSKIAIEGYFKDVGAEKYLKRRPDLRKEMVNTKAKNEYGLRMPKEVKQIVTKLLKSEVEKNSRNIWFESLLFDLMDYGDKNTDAAMAFGICLVYKMEMFDDIVDEYEDEYYYGHENVLDSMSYWDVDEYGNVTLRTYGGLEIDEHLEIFNPENDLDEIDRIAYVKKKKEQQEERAQAFKDVAEIRKESFKNLIRDEILRGKDYD